MSCIIKCLNCKQEREVEEDVVMTVCGCGYTIEIKGGDENGKI